MSHDLARAFKAIVVTPETLDKVKDSIPENLRLIVKTADAKTIDNYGSGSGLTKEQVTSIALAKKIKGKRVLLTSSKAMQREAESNNIATLTYDEFISSIKDRSLSLGAIKGSA
jgi:hypothetical protein